MSSRLGNNPLFNEPEGNKEVAPVQPEKKTIGRPKKDGLVRGNSVQEGLTEEYTRATFIVRCDLLEKLKDYAYTERESLKDVVNDMLEDFLSDKDDLLPHRKDK